ncbi:MAG: helix-hairpin-helix domain-containing protein, partial [Oligoflexia bacterium]|nr:helix-hairpin-helix domain-containing protein [Oligoflexia bacterium]
SQGQATIPVRKRITRTVVSQNQMPTVKICEERADVNRMDKEDFIAVGFSQEAAQNILQARSQRGGRFGSLAELGQIAGVDQGLLKQLEPELGLSGEQTAAAGKQAG